MVMHLAALPDERAASDPGGPCLADGRRELDNASFAVEVRRVSCALVEMGIGRGDVVAVVLANSVELVTVMFAAWRLGAALTPVNPALTKPEAQYQVSDSGARLVVADDSSLSKVEGGAARLCVVDELLQRDGATDVRPPRTEPEQLALVIYTGGTTGRPKGVRLDHANLVATATMIVDWFEMTAADRCLLVLPLFHVNGIMVSVVSPLVAGGSTVIAPRFDPKTFWDLVERVRPTYFSAVPTIYAMLTGLPAEVRPDTASLRCAVCGAAPMPAAAIGEFEDRYGVRILEGYGQSEGTVVTTANPLSGVRKPGTVGLPLPGQEVRVVGEDDEPLPSGQVGEVTVRGPNVMRGYLGKPEETAETLRGGWLHTGDLGRFDGDGYLVLVDRLKDMIIRGGENIYPKEIEDALYAHPSVADAAVVGRPDPLFGEEPVAFVVLRPGLAAKPDELIEHCKNVLAKFKVPRAVFIEADLPRTPIGKIAKPVLRERISSPTARTT
ncbi:MAG TPA: AMP-binding protein [Solirubrobacteraceae bacterium]|nr:AMP-binding protein [Solirubrobacteraceae bacterium]